MKSMIFIALLLLSNLLNAQDNVNQPDPLSGAIDPSALIWFDEPAEKWEEALPVGNGRLGAMIFGGIEEEEIQLNEETYWSGGPYSTTKKGGAEVLPEIQELIFAGERAEAHLLFSDHLLGYPVEQQKYQALGSIHLFDKNKGEAENYARWLDLKSGLAVTEYTQDGISFKREVFASPLDQVIMIRISADKPGSINLKAGLRGIRNGAHSNYATDNYTLSYNGEDEIFIAGKSADYMGVEGKLRYEGRLKIVPRGGSMKYHLSEMHIDRADELILCFAAATNFVSYKDLSANPQERVENYLSGVEGKDFYKMLEASQKEHQRLYNRVSLDLGTSDISFLPTDTRMEEIQQKADPALAALCYHFSRYLLICSSRPGTEAANLQGIWNGEMNPSWDSKYTTNINLQMNYWPAESGNLTECAEPLFDLIRELRDQGTDVAREHYGAGGWVFHQNTDLWRVAAPMDGTNWGTFTTGGAWLVTHLWEHYLYTMDKDFLDDLYPVIKGSVEFFMDFLVEHPNGKWLITNPSTSPENTPNDSTAEVFFDPVTGYYMSGTTICAGASMDMQIIFDLFSYYLEASRVLEKEDDFSADVEAAHQRLVPPQIGKMGNLQEWADDWPPKERAHRHFSHMYGLYPGNVFSAKRTPEFIEPCKSVLEQRGDGGTGFSRAWKMALWARLYDGERGLKIFKGYLKEQACPQLFAKCFSTPQVDGTFGVGAGITEMIMQSHEGVIDLLPALPAEWNNGSFEGVCARGGFELDIQWEQGVVTETRILSHSGEKCRIDPGVKATLTHEGKKVSFKKQKDGSIEFDTKEGETYLISSRK